MTNLSIEFCQKVKEARRKAKLGQTLVAAQVGCKQAALSMFENGGVTKVNDDVIRNLSKFFNIEIITRDDDEKKEREQKPSPIELLKEAEEKEPLTLTKGFCPNPHCPSNHAYEVEGRVFLRPDRNAADPVGAKFCAVCGEILQKKCPNCGAIVHDGAICSFCGDAYIAL